MKHSLLTIPCLFALALILLLSGCAAQTGQKDSAAGENTAPAKKLVHESTSQLETIRARGTLRVGVSIFVPWVMHDKKNELIGYETDIARQLAEDMGVKVEFIETSWSSILLNLLADDYDIIISGLSLTPPRALLVNFSEPYNHSSSVLIANRKLAGKLKSKTEFNNKNISIGVAGDSIGENLISNAFPEATTKTFESESQAIAALLDGRIHAMISSTPRPGYLLSRHGKELFQPFSEPFSTHAEGFAIRKGDADFLNYLNTWIRYNTQNDWLSRRHHHWFNTIDWAGQL